MLLHTPLYLPYRKYKIYWPPRQLLENSTTISRGFKFGSY
jgi:hypothetical protein